MKISLSFSKKNRYISFVLAVVIATLVFTGALAAGENVNSNFSVVSAPVTRIFLSGAAYDGWVLESGENSSQGGVTSNHNATTLVVGDNEKNRQSLGIISFNTATLPDNAVVTSARLILQKQGFVGNPFTALGDLTLDIKDGAFSQNVILQLEDFSAPAAQSGQERVIALADAHQYAADLSAASFEFISRVGVTQFRLRYTLDDNNNLSADYIKFFAGNSYANAPQLIVTYDLGAPPPPTPLSPLSGSTVCGGTINFSWKPSVDAATEYYFEYSGATSGNSGWINAANYSVNLAAGTYTWHVKARNAIGESAWGTSATLTIGDCPLPPTLISPPNGAKVFTGPISFTWNPATYATEYYFEYSGATSGNSGWISATNYAVDLKPGTYFWRVKARNALSESGWSETWKLIVVDTPVAPPDGVIFLSGAAYDGWILESGENSNQGGVKSDNNATTLLVGDNEKNRQYLSVISFNTSTLPPNVVITSAQLLLQKQGFVGNPFTTLGDLVADIKNGAFSQNVLLQLEDFSAPASPNDPIPVLPIGDAHWYAADLSAASLQFISRVGVTQFRLRYTLDDNNNLSADYIRFFSGNAYANAPQLIVKYYIPDPPVPPDFISPSSGSTICTGAINFSWTPNAEPTTEYYFEYSGATSGDSGWISATNYSANLAAGTYTWHVKARNVTGESAWGTSATLTVGGCPLPPTLASPPSGATVFNPVSFTWNSSTYATEYYLEYSGATSGNSGWISATNYSANLAAGTYTWHVQARNAISASESGWSETWTLTVVNPPTLASPLSRATLPTGTINFTWNAVSGATEYCFAYGSAACDAPSSASSGWISATNYSANLSAGAYTWHVKARNAISTSDWSATSWAVTIYSVPNVWVHVQGTGFEFTGLNAPGGTGGWIEIRTQNTVSNSIDPNVIYTQTRAIGGIGDADWVRWRPTIATSGYYRVCVFAPLYTNTMGVTNKARYTIHHANGDSNPPEYPTRQSDFSNGWMDMGRYQFNSGVSGYIYMGDYTGDNPIRLISADAAKFVWSPFGAETCP